MKKPRQNRKSPLSDAEIDALYGLEPVIEPGQGDSMGAGGEGSEGYERFLEISCPYCGESLTVAVDLSAGGQSYVEDCQVCCQPMTLSIELDERGRFVRIGVERMDR